MTYALDSSGTASANLVTGETAAVNTQGQISDTYIFPLNGPFYEKGAVLNFAPISGPARQLVPQVDYAPDFAIKGVMTGNDIYGAFRIINKSLVGTITMSYHALGGAWSMLQSPILQTVSTTAIDPKVAYFALVPSPPIIVPGTTATLSLSSATAVALAQSLNPSGVFLTIAPQELPEADQLSILSPNGVGDSTPPTGAPPMSSNYAQETGGNLDIIAQETTVIAQGQATATTAAQAAAAASTSAANASTQAATAITAAATAITASAGAQGAVTDLPYGGSGNASLVSLEKGSFTKLAEIDSKLSSGLVVMGPSSTALAADATLQTINTSVQQLVTAVKGTQAIDGSVWVDIVAQPARYYVRREVFSTTLGAYVVSWENPDGSAASPTLANLVVAGASTAGAGANTVDQLNLTYSATTTGTGFSTNDILIHSYGLNTATSPATLSYNVWFNATTGQTLTTAPSNGSFAQVGMSTVTVSSTVLAPNAAQETGGNLAALAAVHGTISDAAYNGSGTSTISATLRGMYAALKGVLNIRALASGTDSITIVPSGTQQISGTVTTTPSGTQTVAGTVTANIGTTNGLALDGTDATGVTPPAGAVGVRGWLSGIYSKLAGTLTTVLSAGAAHVGSVTIDTALPAGGNAIGTVGVNSLPALAAGANAIGTVGVTSLPALTTGANTIGAVTAPGGGALATTADITALTNAVKATIGISGTVWFDPTVNPPVYYVRRESINEGTGVETISWFNPDGTAATPTLNKLQAAGDAQNLQSTSTNYTVTTAGTGYAVGDLLIHAFAIDRGTGTPSMAYNFWINATQSTVMATAPTLANLTQSTANSVAVTSSALPSNAAQETGGHLAAIDTVQGAVADAAWSGTGSASIVSLLKALWGRMNGVSYMLASDGVYVPFDSLSQTMVWTAGNMTSVYATYGGHTYTQTLSYDGSNNCTGVSQLVMS